MSLQIPLPARLSALAELKCPEQYASLASSKLALEAQNLATIWTRLAVFQVLVGALYAGGIWLMSVPPIQRVPAATDGRAPAMVIELCIRAGGAAVVVGALSLTVVLATVAWPRPTIGLFTLDAYLSGIQRHLQQFGTSVPCDAQAEYERQVILNCLGDAADSLQTVNALRQRLMHRASLVLMLTGVIFSIGGGVRVLL